MKLAILMLLATLAPAIPLRASEFVMPAPEVLVLDNGLRVAVFPDSRLPLAQILLLVPAGSTADPPGEAGVAYLTAEMMGRGTSSRDARTYAAELDRLAGRVSGAAARDYSTVTGTFLAGDLEAGLEIMSDAVVHPSFEGGELEKLASRTLATYGQLRSDPANFTAEQAWAAVFAGHPYSRPTFGNPDDVKGLSPQSLLAFYGAHWRPDRATLAIAGDVTPERAFAAAREWFGRWEGRAAPALPRPFEAAPGPGGGKLRIRMFDAPELEAAEIRFGLATPGRGHADEAALTLASAILGGGSGSRLGRLAGEPGFGRRARSLHVAQRDAGIFTLSVTVGADSAARIVRRLADELRRFVAEPPTEAELDAARRLTLRLMPMQFETPGALLNHWSTAQFYGLPDGEYERHRERIAALGAAEVAAAARRWLDPDRMVVVVVGPAAKLRAPLEKLGPIEMIGVDAPGAPAEVAPRVEAAPPTKAEVERGREIVRRALVAHGGAARLRGIKDSTVEADALLRLGGQQVTGRIVQVRKEPFKLLFTTSIEGMETTQTLNGDRAWAGSTAMPEEAPQDLDSLGVKGMRGVFSSDLPHLLLAAADPGTPVASRGRRKLGEREAEVVEMGSGPGRAVLYFDPGAHHLLAKDDLDEGADGAGALRVFSDLRSVQGVWWPFSEERILAGERVMKLSVTRVTLDSGVDDSIFEKPEAALPPPVR